MKRFSTCICLALIQTSAQAEDTTWSAFGTVGIVSSDSQRYGYRHNISVDDGVFAGDLDFGQLSLIGGQVEHAFNESFDVVTQAVLRDQTNTNWKDYVSMAFFRYSPSAKWTFRVGRVAPDLFTISDYRNINIAYTWANVPNEVYGMIPYTYIDGADVSYTQRLEDATLNFKIFGGVSESAISTGNFTQSIDLEDLIGAALTFDKIDWNLQWRYTYGLIGSNDDATNFIVEQIDQIPDNLWPNKQNIYNALSLDGQSVKYYSFSGQRFVQNWLLGFELTHIDSASQAVSKLTNGYFSAAYQKNEHTWYTVYAQTSSDHYEFNEPGVRRQLFPELVEALESNFNFYSSNQRSLSIGWRWDMTPNMSSKFQISHTRIDERGETLWINNSDSSPKQTVTTIIYTLSFVL